MNIPRYGFKVPASGIVSTGFRTSPDSSINLLLFNGFAAITPC